MLDTGKAGRAATVVPFRSRSAGETRRERGIGGIGQILLFTGIRYERRDGEETAPPAPVRLADERRPEAER